MQVVSGKFLSSLKESHRAVVRFAVFGPDDAGRRSPVFAYDPLTDDPSSSRGIRIIDGSVTIDKRSPIRSRFELKLIDPTGLLVPEHTVDDVLSIFGNEMQIWRGIAYEDGTDPEYVLLGTFRISKVVPTDAGDGGVTIAVSGYDRARTISRNVVEWYWPNHTDAYPFGGDTFAELVRPLLEDRYPGIRFRDDLDYWISQQNDTSVVLGQTGNTGAIYLQDGQDPWGFSVDLAKAMGCELFQQRNGLFVWQRDPAYHLTLPKHPDVAYDFTEGDDAVFTEATRTLDDEKGFNSYVVVGTGTSAATVPLRSDMDADGTLGTATEDTDPSSPTFVDGPYGRVLSVVTSSYMVTKQQVDDYAQLLLRSTVGVQESVELPMMVNPALDPDDVVSVTRDRIGIDNVLYIIDSTTIPLQPTQPGSLVLRERRALE